MISRKSLVLLLGVLLALTEAQRRPFTEDTFSNCIETTKPVKACVSEHHCERTVSGCFRSVDGTCNNKKNTEWGAVNTPLFRKIRALYADNYDLPRGHHADRNAKSYPTPHQVSKAAFQSTDDHVTNGERLSTLFMTFGQFIDHDMSVAPHEECNVTDCSQSKTRQYPCFPIKFDHHTKECSGLGRAKPACKTDQYEPRNQVNELTAYLDLSQVYGTSEKKAKRLRKLDGSGQMKVDRRNLLPVDHGKTKNTVPMCKNALRCHLVGDDRGEENIALFAMHILFVREHNRIAKELKWINPHWTGERIYQTTRKILGAIFQHIVYEEYLPKIIYPFDRKRSVTTKYNPHINPSISNVFSAVAFRFGHSLIPNSFTQMGPNFEKVHDDIKLQHSFENSTQIMKFGIGPTIIGLCGNMSDTVDNVFAEDILKKLFVFPGSKLERDLTALNIQRGRDHGIPTYGKWREHCGHPPARDFYDLLYTPKRIVKAFSRIYKNVNDIDLFAAGITERHVGSKIVGPTFHCIIQDQFKRLRDGDRFFYTHENVFTPSQLKSIKKMTLSKILCNNLRADGMVSLQREAFKVFDKITDRRVVCESIEDIDLTQWRDRSASSGYGYVPPKSTPRTYVPRHQAPRTYAPRKTFTPRRTYFPDQRLKHFPQRYSPERLQRRREFIQRRLKQSLRHV